MSTGVIFILGKGVSPILASGVKSTWPQGSSEPGFSTALHRKGFAGNAAFRGGSADATAITEASRRLGEILPVSTMQNSVFSNSWK